jgi:hypothetical protein
MHALLRDFLSNPYGDIKHEWNEQLAVSEAEIYASYIVFILMQHTSYVS